MLELTATRSLPMKTRKMRTRRIGVDGDSFFTSEGQKNENSTGWGLMMMMN